MAMVTALAAGLAGCGDPELPRASLSVIEALSDADTAGYARALEPPDLVFPADHGPHPTFRHEWWYFTGNVETDAGRPFGFQLTFFRNALRPDSPAVESPWATRQAYMAHFAVTDIASGTFGAWERFDRAALGLAGAQRDPVRVWVGDWQAEWTGPAAVDRRVATAGSEPGHAFRLRAASGAAALELVLRSLKPVVEQGEGGLSAKGPGPGNASNYYSLTRLAAEGRLTVDGVAHEVSGLAWLDREWSTSALSPGIVGWDWFSLQLDEGTELMLYRLRSADGGTSPYSAGSFVGLDGRVTRLAADDFALEAVGSWSSRRGGTYPSGWRIRVPAIDLTLTVEPRLRDQELQLTFRYWEGAVGLAGRRAGRDVAGSGYVELTGYGGQ